MTSAEQEVQRRHEMWEELCERGGPKSVGSTLVRELGIYRGQAGIWRDKDQTAELTGGESGATVSVLHTGQSYADDLSEGGVIYHYPDTGRVGSRDENEVEATKNACRLEIPIFVVVYPEEDDSKRNVYLGRVTDWNDETEEFLILFDADADALSETVSEIREPEQEPFQLTGERSNKAFPQPSRPEQGRFRFNVFKRYGKKCAVCEINIEEVLVAAHIRGKAENGSDDARNGLVLCKNHHAAFDEGLFSIEPETHLLHTQEEGPSEEELKIKHSRLNPARNEPHEEAVRWHWDQWTEEQ
ncbi:HNH endonuclease [Salinibacter sp.]|uniref:HNH endonuclease n=1 Tax=Salinibacter sp. TaxID=2065818 RepID=UPI0021E86929|nr:HNH endonuclease [Salinibacter sp.]